MTKLAAKVNGWYGAFATNQQGRTMKKDRPFWLLETRDCIAIVLVGGMVALVFVLALRPSAVPDTPMFNMIVGGYVTVGFTSIIQFYFGSSKGSVAKDDTINAMSATAAETPKIVAALDPLAKYERPKPAA